MAAHGDARENETLEIGNNVGFYLRPEDGDATSDSFVSEVFGRLHDLIDGRIDGTAGRRPK